MNISEESLRRQVDKWLGSGDSAPIRVTRIDSSDPHHSQCVCVEASRPAGSLAIVFFRHDDGSWNVYPQQTDRPMMSAYKLAA